jgi:hypothetical protein
MLAAIESGMVKRIVDCRPQLAVYQGLVTHVARSAGYSSWDKHGPRYSIQNDGRIAYSGHFDDNKSALRSISNQINVQLSKSYFYNNFFGQNKYRLTEDDIRLFIEIVEESHRKLAEIYPGMTFSVIIWDVGYNNIVDPENVYQKIRNGLTEKGFDIHAISNIIPGIADNRAKYEISSYDKHPNALSHRLIAEYLVRNVVRGE